MSRILLVYPSLFLLIFFQEEYLQIQIPATHIIDPYKENKQASLSVFLRDNTKWEISTLGIYRFLMEENISHKSLHFYFWRN
jgi:hypothetical protein